MPTTPNIVLWEVDDVDDLLLLYDVQKVFRGDDEAGPFTEITDADTRVPLVTGLNEYRYPDRAGEADAWYQVTYYNSDTTAESAASAAAKGGGNYTTIGELRTAGWTTFQATDADLLRAITDAEMLIEEITGRWFYPQYKTVRVDGNDTGTLPISETIIQIDEATVLSNWAEVGVRLSEIDIASLRIPNRHLTQGLKRPDDRDAPVLEYQVYAWLPDSRQRRVTAWYVGVQNVELVGWFGYTELGLGDPVGELGESGSQIPLSKGRTPRLVRHLMSLLVARTLPSPADQDAYEDAVRAGDIVKYKTRDQEVSYAKGSGGVSAGAWATGDLQIDRYLSMLVEPVEMAFI